MTDRDQPMVPEPDVPTDEVESRTKATAPGSSPSTDAATPNSSGEKAPAPEIGEAEEAVSRESRRLAEAEDTEL